MKWFKHYSNADSSIKLTKLLDELGTDGYGKYWLLLEILSQEFDGKSEFVYVHQSKLKQKLKIKFDKKLATFLQKLSNFSLTFFELSEKVYKFDVSILLKLQNKDFKYDRCKRVSSDPKNKEIRNKKKNKKKNFPSPPAWVVSDAELQEVFDNYPLDRNQKLFFKQSKSGRKKFKTEKEFQDFKKAVENYRADVTSRNVEDDYIMIITNFVNCYEDWVNRESLKKKSEMDKFFDHGTWNIMAD